MPLFLALALATAGDFQKTTPVGSAFALTCDGRPIGTFAKATGLDVSVAMPEYRSGDGVNYSRQLAPGMVKYQPIDLQGGVVAPAPRTAMMGGGGGPPLAPQQRLTECDIALLSTDGAPVTSWALKNPTVLKMEGPPGNLEIELNHEGLIQKP